MEFERRDAWVDASSRFIKTRPASRNRPSRGPEHMTELSTRRGTVPLHISRSATDLVLAVVIQTHLTWIVFLVAVFPVLMSLIFFFLFDFTSPRPTLFFFF